MITKVSHLKINLKILGHITNEYGFGQSILGDVNIWLCNCKTYSWIFSCSYHYSCWEYKYFPDLSKEKYKLFYNIYVMTFFELEDHVIDYFK